MAVCQGITNDGSAIIINYVADDGTKGSFSDNVDPYTLQDVYDTAVFNGWGVVTKAALETYIIDGRYLRVYGSNTYLKLYNIKLIINSTYVFNIYAIDAGRITANLSTFEAAYGKYIYFKGRCDFLKCQFISDRGYYKFIGFDSVNICELSDCSFGGGTFSLNTGIYSLFERTLINYVIYALSPSINSSLNNYVVAGCAVNLYTTYIKNNEVAEIRNIKFLSDPKNYSILIKYVSGGGTLKIYDSDINFNDYVLYVGTGNIILKYFTTFNATIKDSSGGTLNIYDRFENIVYSEIMSSDNMIEQEIQYVDHDSKMTANVSDYDNLIELQPFKFEIIKEGFETLVIENIIVKGGVKTLIQSSMILSKPVKYYQLEIIGNVSGSEIKGEISVSEIVGIVSELIVSGASELSEIDSFIINKDIKGIINK